MGPPERWSHTVSDPAEQPPAPLLLPHRCVHSSPRPSIPAGCVPAGHGAEAGCGMGCPAVAAGGPSCALWGAAVESPHLFPPSRSNGVPVPRHGDGRGLPRGTLTGTRTRRLQHLPGCAAATAHPHLRRVSTRAAAGTACLGVGGSFAAASLRFCCHQRRHRASGTGCSSPSACLASGSVKPPPGCCSSA